MGGTSCQSRLIIWGRDWSAAWAVSVTARRGAVDAPGKAKQCGTVHGGGTRAHTSRGVLKRAFWSVCYPALCSEAGMNMHSVVSLVILKNPALPCGKSCLFL